MTQAPHLAGIELVLITGMSGSGKSVALNALEDAGFYCVDNLPPELLLQLMVVERDHGASRVAIAMDVRSAKSLPLVPNALNALEGQGVIVKPFFVDATTDTLVRRYSESRRRHPLSTVKNEVNTAVQDADGNAGRAAQPLSCHRHQPDPVNPAPGVCETPGGISR
jgi:RNase adaptor protein for sRNA GlmZ degradation